VRCEEHSREQSCGGESAATAHEGDNRKQPDHELRREHTANGDLRSHDDGCE